MVALLGRILFVVATALQLGGERWTGRAEAPVDGDTLRVRDTNDRLHKVRILGIDAPEDGQPFAAAARDHLARVTRDREVEVTETGTDAAGRTVARVRMKGNDLALDMVAAGYAWYERAALDDPALAAEERKARAATVGLWVDKDPIAPWEWRKAQAERRRARQAKRALGAGPANPSKTGEK